MRWERSRVGASEVALCRMHPTLKVAESVTGDRTLRRRVYSNNMVCVFVFQCDQVRSASRPPRLCFCDVTIKIWFTKTVRRSRS